MEKYIPIAMDSISLSVDVSVQLHVGRSCKSTLLNYGNYKTIPNLHWLVLVLWEWLECKSEARNKQVKNINVFNYQPQEVPSRPATIKKAGYELFPHALPKSTIIYLPFTQVFPIVSWWTPIIVCCLQPLFQGNPSYRATLQCQSLRVDLLLHLFL
jgi:hypothetical protein